MRFIRRAFALLLLLHCLPAGASAQEQPTGVFILEHELKQICSKTDWIPSDSTCRALDSLLAPVLKFRREGAEVALIGLNAASETIVDRLAIHDKPGALDRLMGH